MKKLSYILFLLAFGCKTAKEIRSTDEHYQPFLEKFEQDSIFQASRINFPLLRLELDTVNRDTIQKWIQEKDYQKIHLIPPYPRQLYSEEFTSVEDRLLVEIRGYDEKIIIDYHFQKKKWKVVFDRME